VRKEVEERAGAKSWRGIGGTLEGHWSDVEVRENAGVVRLGRELGELAADVATAARAPGVLRAVAVAGLDAGRGLAVAELLAGDAAGEPVREPPAPPPPPEALEAAVGRGLAAVRRAHAQARVAQGAAAAELRRPRCQEGRPRVGPRPHPRGGGSPRGRQPQEAPLARLPRLDRPLLHHRHVLRRRLPLLARHHAQTPPRLRAGSPHAHDIATVP
jgi:hypothetical protein